MDYVGRIYRPPSEARSLLVQATIGCSHNGCTYCDMYSDKRFKPKALEQIEEDFLEAKRMGPVHSKAFLCDGDTLILPTKRLLTILEMARKHTPWIKRVGVYGDTRSVGRKSVEELRELKAAGLGIVYHGMESGDDEVLLAIDKGGTREEMIETARRLREAGIVHSVMVLLGVGGKKLSAQHARNTASVLTAMDPPFVGALTTTVVPGTKMHEAQLRGEFELPGKFRMIEELREIVAGSDFSDCRFSANHASNYVPIRSTLPQDKDALLEALDHILNDRDERRLKPESLRAL
jgi:radical SAM superfamily enzyme YgiQ (UPF0313 family)